MPPAFRRAVALVVLAVATPGAQQREAGTESQQPTFRAGVNVVRVDVSVTGRHDEAIETLDASSFRVSEDGVPQKVETAQFIRLTGEPDRSGRDLKVRDLGAHGPGAVDYPDYASAVARAVASGEADFGVLICGSGIGMSIAANKVSGIRAALVSDVETVRLARQHNDANVLVLAANRTDLGSVPAIVDAWLDTGFEGGRHEQRIKKIDDLERER